MAQAYNIPIIIQKKNEETEKWVDFLKVHAKINKLKYSEYYKAGAIRNNINKTFEIRYNAKIKEIEYNTSIFRIVYDNTFFNIVDYDDFMESHINIKLIGTSYE